MLFLKGADKALDRRQDKQGEGQYLLSIKQRAAVINARLVKAEKTAVKKRNRQQHGENCKGRAQIAFFLLSVHAFLSKWVSV